MQPPVQVYPDDHHACQLGLWDKLIIQGVALALNPGQLPSPGCLFLEPRVDIGLGQ